MFKNFREILCLTIVALFGFALVQNPKDALLVGALLSMASTAVGFYLGGSKMGSDTATQNANTLAESAKTASGTPLPVQVINPPSSPVPVEPA